MDKVIYAEVPHLTVQPCMRYAYPTRLSHVFDCQPEQISLPQEYVPAQEVSIKIATGHTGERRLGSWRWKAYRAANGLLRGKETLDYSGKFIFDSRDETDRNPAHIIDNTVTSALLIKKTIKEKLNQDVDIHVILRKNSTGLARDSCHLLGIPTISTDDDVYGEVVSISEHSLPSIRPQLFNLDFEGYRDMSMERIFISRRGTRQLINNDEVSSFLEDRGFKTCYFEDFPVSEKWSIARDAKFVVAINGAAVANLVFNRLGLEPNAKPRSGVKVLELMSPAWMHMGLRSTIDAVNGRWCSIRGQITPEILQAVDFATEPVNPTKHPHTTSFKVDCQTIQMGLDYLDNDKYDSP